MSIPGERLKTYGESTFDEVIVKIKYGVIKAGRYSHLVKVDKNMSLPKKGVIFNDKRSDDAQSGKGKRQQRSSVPHLRDERGGEEEKREDDGGSGQAADGK